MSAQHISLRPLAAMAIAVAVAVASFVACGGVREESPAQSVDASSGAEGEAPDASLPPGVAYQDGNFMCCAPGIGTQCCTPGSQCREYGGGESCHLPGDGISGKDAVVPCLTCCAGRQMLLVMKLVDGKCVDEAGQHEDAWICGTCGDGLCDAEHGENICNCASDCR